MSESLLPASPMLAVAECMRLTPLDRGEVVAGAETLGTSGVNWIAVIEWPVENFVAAGELVLTTGIGCDLPMLVQLVTEIIESQAAAVLIGVGLDAPFSEVPAAVRRVGDRAAHPIIALPWEVRFADVSRVVIDRLLSARYAATIVGRGRLSTEMTDALLMPDGLSAIAIALEHLIEGPALIVEPGLAIAAAGPRAIDRIGADAVEVQPEAARNLAPARMLEIRRRLEGGDLVRVEKIDELLVSHGLVAPAVAQGAIVGYVIAIDEHPGHGTLEVDLHALEQAATAVAIETLRRRAAAEAEAGARGEFLWESARSTLTDGEISYKARLLGYDPTTRYRVLVGKFDGEAEARGLAYFAEVTHQLRRQGASEGLQVAASAERLLVIIPSKASQMLAPRPLAERVNAAFGAGRMSWGIADGDYSFSELRRGLSRAEQAIVVGRALRGLAEVHDAEQLGPFLMLGRLAGDPEAQEIATEAIQPLLDYDRKTSRALIQTLAVYLEEHGNGSSAARRLHLNRHSLLYRLRKIETLTGRDLNRHEDRFLLDLSLRLYLMTDAGRT